jgi:hypothetical protein
METVSGSPKVQFFSDGNKISKVAQLRRGLHTEPFLGGHLRKVPIYVRGVSVVQFKNGKITQGSDYYDQLNSRLYSVATWFTEWIEP